MNSKILNHYKKLVEENLLYLKDSTIRKSIELYIKELIDDTAQVEEEWAKNHNNNVLKSLHNESLSILERSENKMDKTISKIIVELNQLKSRSFSASIAEQILESLKKFKLKEEYKSFNGLFFEFDADPRFSGIAFKEPNFEVVLEEPKYQKF
ncbi:MAG: hypothetical protein R2784_20180 [Saprospiraceae bacterium]